MHAANASPPPPCRYISTFIADFHRTLMYGGIFLYPANASSPGGKLRLLYEANPASFIAEQAGGRGSNGMVDILDVRPETIHNRTQARNRWTSVLQTIFGQIFKYSPVLGARFGKITRRKGKKTLMFSGFWGPKVGRITKRRVKKWISQFFFK